MTTTAAPRMETYAATGIIEYPSTTVVYQWETTRPVSTSRTSSTTSHKGGVSVTLLVSVIVGVGLLALAMVAWSRWVFVTRTAPVRERRLAEEWAMGGERRAKREALARMVPPLLTEVELGLVGGKEREEGGRFLNLKQARKLPLSLNYLPSAPTSLPSQSSHLILEDSPSLQLSVLILPPLPPPFFTPTPNLDADDDYEQDLPEIQLGTTSIALDISSFADQETWDEILKALDAEKKRTRRRAPKVDASSSLRGTVAEEEGGEGVASGLEREESRAGAWWTRRR